jgi:hypothetical protein
VLQFLRYVVVGMLTNGLLFRWWVFPRAERAAARNEAASAR